MKFWMVYVEGTSGPTYKHSSIESAQKEAERLARLCPGKNVYVLQNLGHCKKVDVEWESAAA